MDIDKAIHKMENFIVCEKCKVSCKEKDCDNCQTQYEAGTVGECIEAMETVLEWVKKNRGSEQERWLRGE